MLPSKHSFLLALQTRQEHTSMMRLRASTLAPVMAEVRGTGAETEIMRDSYNVMRAHL